MAACASTTLVAIKAYEKLAAGFLGINPQDTITYTNKIKMFVDDASKYSNMFALWIRKMPSLADVTHQLRNEAQIWEKCLWTSGGLLQLQKCLYYILYWTFNKEGKASLTPPDSRQEIKLQSSNTKISTKIYQYSPTTEHESLGHFIAPTFTTKLATQKLMDTTQDFIQQLQRSHLNRYEI